LRKQDYALLHRQTEKAEKAFKHAAASLPTEFKKNRRPQRKLAVFVPAVGLEEKTNMQRPTSRTSQAVERIL
jgi:hypothetical protein